MGNTPLLLIVRHGEGHLSNFVLRALQQIGETDPTLRRSIVCHTTEESEPSLDGVGTVVFALRDAVRERHPACFAKANAIATRALEAGIRVVNSPQALSNTVKSVQARIWSDAGIATPPHIVFDSKEALLAQADELHYPVILKSDQFHRQQGMRLCGDGSDLRKALSWHKLKVPIAVASFVDTRKGYARERPGSLWADFYHKKRSVVLGEIVRCRHVLFSAKPIVSLRTCTFSAYRKRKQAGTSPITFIKRLLGGGDGLSPLARRCIAEDNAFFSSTPEEPELLRRACQALGLEVASIDYSVKATGELVLWEANSFSTIATPEHFILPEERRYSERRRQTFEDLERFFSGLLNESGSYE